MKLPLLSLIMALAVSASAAHAQKVPRLGYTYPAGGRQGETFEVTLGGQYLAGARDVYFSGRGISATVIGYERPLNPSETEVLREKLAELEEARKSAGTSAGKDNDARIAELKEKIAKFGNGPMFNVAIAENLKLRVTIAADATLGDQEVRLGGPGGLSNPLVFCVGQVPEFSEAAARGSLKAEIDAKPRGKARRHATVGDAKTEPPVLTLPVTVNGQILPGAEDRFRFHARAGQRVVFRVEARKLIPYLADAVPGWFQATLAVYDAKGRELAFADDFRFNPDPVFCYEIARDGEYEFGIRDAIYRGREDFVYRVTVGELPFITSIFPLGGHAGAAATVSLRGWNLTAPALNVDLAKKTPGLMQLVSTRGQAISNFVPFAIDALPAVLEHEPNNCPIAAQRITLPIIVDGQINQPGDRDLYRIEGKAGDEFVAEIFARRLGSPVDSMIRLTTLKGEEIAVNDDNEDKGAGLTTHHADSRLAVKLPETGVYLLQVGDTQHGGGPEYAYRLRVAPPRPDFELRVVPSSLSGRAGANVPVTVYALRRDGFSGAIALRLNDAPEGFKLAGGSIPAGQDQVKATITLPEARGELVSLQVEGVAKIGSEETVRAAVAADDLQQAFAYHHLVCARDLKVAIRGRLASSGETKLVEPGPVKLPPGGKAEVKLTSAIGEKAAAVEFELGDGPAGITLQHAEATSEGVSLVFASDMAATIGGQRGTLTVFAYQKPAGANGAKGRIPLGALPALAFEMQSAGEAH